MREIRFRCWLPSEKKMGASFDAIDAWNDVDGGAFPKESIFMQFTGLKDKNGKEIYEGDVVKLIEPNRIYTVEWIDYTFKLIHSDPKLDRMTWGSIERLAELNWGIEIIGNIYENSNLL